MRAKTEKRWFGGWRDADDIKEDAAVAYWSGLVWSGLVWSGLVLQKTAHWERR